MPICCSRETWHFLTEVPNGVLAGQGYPQLASQIDRILKGANPADLPIEQPRLLELVINLNEVAT
jgi:ABC-type uncharacterized transport system substrate-binding protein